MASQWATRHMGEPLRNDPRWQQPQEWERMHRNAHFCCCHQGCRHLRKASIGKCVEVEEASVVAEMNRNSQQSPTSEATAPWTSLTPTGFLGRELRREWPGDSPATPEIGVPACSLYFWFNLFSLLDAKSFLDFKHKTKLFFLGMWNEFFLVHSQPCECRRFSGVQTRKEIQSMEVMDRLQWHSQFAIPSQVGTLKFESSSSGFF